jgi:hypothetical protein
MTARLVFKCGYRFPGSRLTYVGEAFPYVRHDGKHQRKVYVKCDCGTKFSTLLATIRCGRCKSCKCLQQELNITNHISHGMSRHPLYKIWQIMKDRCRPDSQDYEFYFDRGISVCKEWSGKDGFNSFYEWVLSLPKHKQWRKNKEIDRINNDFGYSPRNCRFTTRSKNQRNKQKNVYIEDFDGTTRLLIDIIEREDVAGNIPNLVDYYVIYSRIKQLEWSLEEALFTPLLLHIKRRSPIAAKRREVFKDQTNRVKYGRTHG